MELAEVEVRYGLSVNLFFVAYSYTKTYGTGTPNTEYGCKRCR
jgi:hypothetical protein